jgi:NAD-dependent deacetylase
MTYDRAAALAQSRAGLAEMRVAAICGTVADLAALTAGAARITAFTGAGISTECGVPDFRSPGSPWLQWPPIDFQSFVASEDSRREAWRRKFLIDDMWAGAAPGRGHMALARLAAECRLGAVITQNIDGLHHASGVGADLVIELHGNGTYAACLDCAARHALQPIRQAFESDGAPPRCACGGIVKSATVSFGQAMPQAAMKRALAASLDCDLFLVIGSSLVVSPAAQFPRIAKDNGAVLAILNRDPTPLDTLADLVLHCDIGEALTHVAN